MPFLDLQKVRLKSLLKRYQDRVNTLIETGFTSLCERKELEEVCLYALQGDGKRFRPSIVLIIAERLGQKLDAGFSALSVELFHTASLIADDLPCMDDDSTRRCKPALHKVYGTDVALLASYALIGAGYECIFKQRERLDGKIGELPERAFIALQLLAKNNGLEGAPLGQYLDLYPKDMTKSVLDDVLYKKTVIFFETAFVFGWLFGGGAMESVESVKLAGYHFGMAFQIYDDFCDLDQDREKGKVINYPLTLGVAEAKKTLETHLKDCQVLLEQLGLFENEFQELLNFLKNKILD